MAKIRFDCPQCGKHMAAGAEHAGKKARCSGCQQIVQIPAHDASETQPAPSPTPPPPQQQDVHREVNGGEAAADDRANAAPPQRISELRAEHETLMMNRRRWNRLSLVFGGVGIIVMIVGIIVAALIAEGQDPSSAPSLTGEGNSLVGSVPHHCARGRAGDQEESS